MNVNPLRSITAKLLYVTVGVIAVLVALFCWLTSDALKDQTASQFRGDGVVASRATASAVAANLDRWDQMLSDQMKLVMATRGDERQIQIVNTVQSNRDLWAFELFEMQGDGRLVSSAFAFTPFALRSAFDLQPAPLISRQLRARMAGWLAQEIRKRPGQQSFVASLGEPMGLPSMIVARYHYDSFTNQRYWGVVTTALDAIVGVLRDQNGVKSLVIGQDGQVFAARNFAEVKAGRIGEGADLARAALKSSETVGYRDRYVDATGTAWRGAFANIPSYRLSVLVLQNASMTDATIGSALWKGALFGLLGLVLGGGLSVAIGVAIRRSVQEAVAGVKKISSGDFKMSVAARTKDEIGFLTQSLNMMAFQIQQLLYSKVQKFKEEREQETAEAIHNLLFPKTDKINLESIRLAGISKPRSISGGDWWAYHTNGAGVTYLFIADADGQGFPTAVVMGMVYSCCLTLGDYTEKGKSRTIPPQTILEHCNRVVFEATQGSLTISLLVLAIDVPNRTISYANAGLDSPILVPRERGDSRLRKQNQEYDPATGTQPISLKSQAVKLGADPSTKYKDTRLALVPGDKFVLFTNGLVDGASPEGYAWGRKRLLEQVVRYADRPADLLLENLLEEAYKHFNSRPLEDDLTVVTVEFPAVGLDAKEAYTAPNPDLEETIEYSADSSFARMPLPPPVRVVEPPVATAIPDAPGDVTVPLVARADEPSFSMKPPAQPPATMDDEDADEPSMIISRLDQLEPEFKLKDPVIAGGDNGALHDDPVPLSHAEIQFSLDGDDDMRQDNFALEFDDADTDEMANAAAGDGAPAMASESQGNGQVSAEIAQESAPRETARGDDKAKSQRKSSSSKTSRDEQPPLSAVEVDVNEEEDDDVIKLGA